MRKRLLISFALLSLITTSVLAEELQLQYKQRNLPGGGSEMEYNGLDGSKVKQVQRGDGTIETQTTDAQGNKTVTTQRPDGSVDVNSNVR